MEASTLPPELADSPALQRTAFHDWWHEVMAERAVHRTEIDTDPTNTEAKLAWLDADAKQRDVIETYVELGLCHGD